MSAPVIITTQSVLEALQYQSWVFQPHATNSPTYWNAAFLPPGMSLDTTTGAISGAATRPGVYVFSLTAGNADGASTPVLFSCGIEATSALPVIDAVDVVIDLATGLASVLTPAGRKVTRGTVEVLPLFWLKRGDTRVFQIRFVKGGVIADIALASLKLAVKAFEPEGALVVSSTFVRCAVGPDTFYRLAVEVAGLALDGELSNAEDDFKTELAALGEFEWSQVNTLSPIFPTGNPDKLRSSSLNFDVGIARDLIPNNAADDEGS